MHGRTASAGPGGAAAATRGSPSTRGTGRPTSSPPTAASCTCARSCPTDADALVALHDRLSARTRYLRYFGPHPYALREGAGAVHRRRPRTRVALVALLGDEIIAVGRYEGTPAAPGPAPRRSRSSSATTTRAAAWARSCSSTSPPPPASGGRAASRPRSSPRTARWCGSSATPATRSAARSRRACCTWSRRRPHRAVGGGARRPRAARGGPQRGQLLSRARWPSSAPRPTARSRARGAAALLRGDFAGPVYPVNPDARSVRGVRAYASVTDIPDEVDLAVVAVPAAGHRAT